ncbi:hypothetical protein IJ798_02045 [Candidatus Saccharibacteria bacterium]|nr:hypothetical protein [Candidatus Saccharibacteria bacterium]
MGEKIEKTLTIIEGRDCNQPIAEEIRDTAIKSGFKANILKTISSVDIANGTLDRVFGDCVIWRGPVDMKSMYETERVISYLHESGKLLINANPTGGRICTSNKFFQHGLFQLDPVLREHTLEMHMALSKVNLYDLLERGRLQYPFLLKPDLGTRGEGILLIKSAEDIEKFDQNYYEFSTETYVKSSYDWRVFVLGGVALGAMRKQGDMQDASNFRSRSGGLQHWGEEDPEVLKEINELAVRAAKISGLEYAGMDIVRDDETGKYILLETNIAAGWQNGFFESTGVSVSQEFVNWFSDRAMLYEQSVYNAVKTYVERRLRFLLKESKEKYQRIISFEEKSKMSESEARVLLESSGVALEGKLQGAYTLISLGKTTWVDKVKIQDLLSSIEEYEISRFGNFIGKDSGSLEESLERTTYYLAVRSKLS